MYDHLRRGAVAGAVGGGAYGLYVALVATPLVEYAEALAHQGHEHSHDHAAVSEGVVHAASVGSGVALGLLFGLVVFGVVAYLVEPALPDRAGSYLLGLAGFITVSGVPWLVLPPIPPGVETGLSADAALVLYAGSMAVGALACLGAGAAVHRVADRGRAVGVLAGVAVFAALVGPAVAVAPSPTTEGAVSRDFRTLYTGAILAGQLCLWGLTAAAHDRLRPGASPAGPRLSPTTTD